MSLNLSLQITEMGDPYDWDALDLDYDGVLFILYYIIFVFTCICMYLWEKNITAGLVDYIFNGPKLRYEEDMHATSSWNRTNNCVS